MKSDIFPQRNRHRKYSCSFSNQEMLYIKSLLFEYYSTKRGIITNIFLSRVYFGLGKFCQKHGEDMQAIQYFKYTLHLDQENSDSYASIAEILFKHEKWQEALFFVKRAIRLNTKKSTYWLLLAELETQLGDHSLACEAFEISASLNGNDSEVWLKWSFLKYRENSISEAIDILKCGLEKVDKQAQVLYRIAAYWFTEGKYKTATEYLELAIYIDYDLHTELYTFFPNLKARQALSQIISHLRNR